MLGTGMVNFKINTEIAIEMMPTGTTIGGKLAL
jgi:hypothetical protein